MTAIVTSWQITDYHDIATIEIDDLDHGVIRAWQPICNREVVDNLVEVTLTAGTDSISINWDRFVSGLYPVSVVSVIVRAILSSIDWIEVVDLSGFDSDALVGSQGVMRQIQGICYDVSCDIKRVQCYEGVNISDY